MQHQKALLSLFVRYLLFSEVFPIEECVALAEDNIACVAELVLLAHVAHIEKFLVVQDKEGTGAVKIGTDENGCEGPNHELLQHEHANNAGNIAKCKGVAKGTDVHIVAVFTTSNVSPIFLSAGLVVTWTSLKNIAVEELHAESESSLMILGDATVAHVQIIEVVLGGGEELASQQNRHCFLF